jgi:hypothetical protein
MMAKEKEVFVEFMNKKEKLIDIKRELDLEIKLLEERESRIDSREEKILDDARQRIEMSIMMQEKVKKQCKLFFNLISFLSQVNERPVGDKR